MDVWLGLGSNLGDRVANLRLAIATLERIGRVGDFSPVYETEPWGLVEQPRFLNAVCRLQTDLGPHSLLDALKGIERAMGRLATLRHGPRPIDLDILLYGSLRIDTPRLKIPHPGMLERSTVLVPLADCAPDLRHPVTGRSVAYHLAHLGEISGVAPFPPGLEGTA